MNETFSEQLSAVLDAYEKGNPETRKLALKELQDMAEIADLGVEVNAAMFPAKGHT